MQMLSQDTNSPQNLDQVLGKKLDQGMKRMSNGHKVKQFFNRFIQQEINVAISLLASFMLIYSYYEYDFNHKYENSSHLILIAITISVFFIIFFLILRFNAFNELKKADLQENQVLGPLSLCIQILVVLIQPYPFFNSWTFFTKNYLTLYQAQYKVNYVLVLLSFIRFALILPIASRSSKYLTPRATRICRMYGSQPNFHYTIKCMFKQKPIQLIISWFAFSIMLFALAFRVSDRGVAQPNTYSVYDYFSNSIWLTLITMTSVGYGDIFPITDLGRIVGCLCMFWGGFTVSVMVVVLTNTLDLDQRQKRSLMIIKRLQLKKQMRVVAGRFIRESIWRLWKNYSNKNKKIKIQQNDAQKAIQKEFNILRKVSKNSLMNIDLHQDMIRHFQRVQSHLQNLKSNAGNLIDYINEEYFSSMHNSI